MRRKEGKLHFVKDIKHWIGWILTVLALVGLLTLFGINVGWIGVLMLFVIVGVDIIKHVTGLQ